MTTDGISTEDWEVVKDFAAKIANAVCAEDNANSQRLTEDLLRYLERLETKYGRLPSIIATKADYTTELNQRVQLLKQAYALAKQSNDKVNMTLTASSLAQLFVEETLDLKTSSGGRSQVRLGKCATNLRSEQQLIVSHLPPVSRTKSGQKGSRRLASF